MTGRTLAGSEIHCTKPRILIGIISGRIRKQEMKRSGESSVPDEFESSNRMTAEHRLLLLLLIQKALKSPKSSGRNSAKSR